jgi:hypothetical protein
MPERSELEDARTWKIDGVIFRNGSGHGPCASCLKDRDLPLRRDDMGGYVCLTCTDKRLSALADEVAVLKTQLVKLRFDVFNTIEGDHALSWSSDQELIELLRKSIIESKVALITRAFDEMMAQAQGKVAR